MSLVVGLGGHTSTALVRAALTRGIPFILLEKNAIPGRTTRWLSRSAAMVCAAFDQVRPHLHVQAPVTVTGNPARPEFENGFNKTPKNLGLHDDGQPRGDNSHPTKQLVVLGGTGGASSLNETIPGALRKLGQAVSDWQIVHQTGEGQLQETEFRYKSCGVKALAVTYLDEIASILFQCDLVISRAGGTTLAELALAGVPALLVPCPQAPDDHQLANAKVVEAAGAARLVDETSHSGELDTALARELKPLLTDVQLRQSMSENMRRLARPHASEDIAMAVHDTLYGTRPSLIAA